MKFVKNILVRGLMAVVLMAVILGHCAYASDHEIDEKKSFAPPVSVLKAGDIEDKTAEKPKVSVNPVLQPAKADSTSPSSYSYFWSFFSYTKNKVADGILLGVWVAENVTSGTAILAASGVMVGKGLANFVVDTSADLAKYAIDTTEWFVCSGISLTKKAAERLKGEQLVNKTA